LLQLLARILIERAADLGDHLLQVFAHVLSPSGRSAPPKSQPTKRARSTTAPVSDAPPKWQRSTSAPEKSARNRLAPRKSQSTSTAPSKRARVSSAAPLGVGSC